MRRSEFHNLTVLALLLVAAILGFTVPASSLHLRAVPTANASASTSSTQEESQQQNLHLVVNDGNADYPKKSYVQTHAHPDTNVGRILEDEAWNSNFDYSNFDYDRSDGESTTITYGDKTIQVSDDPSYWQWWVWAIMISVGLILLCCLRKCCCR